MSNVAASTPAMAQFHAAKQRHPEAILFFRMGDFYELFFDDAKTASRELGLTLTSRSKGEGAIPMAGVPVRALDGYLKRLVQKGHRVAICEQMQDPREAKGVVERQVVRVVTPGTLTEDSLLDSRRANHLAAVALHKDQAGIAWVELSTGAFMVQQCPRSRLAEELALVEPAELLLSEELRGDERPFLDGIEAPITFRAPYDFGVATATRVLQTFFAVATLEGFGVVDMPQCVGAAGALIGYLQETQLTALPHIRSLVVHSPGQLMRLDRATRQSLELVETMRGNEGTPLLAILDRSLTPMGARLLRAWLLAPLAEVDAIAARQQAVAELVGDVTLLNQLTEHLQHVLDLERLTARAAFGRANARDLVALRLSLEQLPAVRALLADCKAPALRRIAADLDPVPELTAEIAATLVDEPPLQLKDGGLIREGRDRELDDLRTLARDSTTWLSRYQQQLVEATGIASLKISFNKVFGYYIEVTHTHREVELPKAFVRKQTTKNAERYVTDELRGFESKVLKAEDSSRSLEYDLFTALRQQVGAEIARLQATAMLVAELDVFQSFASVARDRAYNCPEIDDSLTLRIEDGRHPVIEATHAAGTFVPNDTDLAPPEHRLVILTGPNMAGKSTYIRQNALIVLLAQVGSFVPAKTAHIGVVDRIFTRVGSADDISRGASTFMVEMTETANILNNATRRSLVILDEVGRGTSTYDGLSLAWAIAEDLHDRIGCRGLFATHYHQLMELAGEGKGIVNQRVAVREWGDSVVFLHRIENGGTDRSYGLHVAALAGIRKPVLERARAVLAAMEQGHAGLTPRAAPAPKQGPRQQSLFVPPAEPLLDELRALDLDGLTPRQALALLSQWQQHLRGAQ